MNETVMKCSISNANHRAMLILQSLELVEKEYPKVEGLAKAKKAASDLVRHLITMLGAE